MISGLLGIGGGVLAVPFFYLLMSGTLLGVLPVLPEHQAALAHATSLALIVPTALSGLRAYERKGLVEWSVVLPLGTGAGVAAVLGAQLAARLPSLGLKVAFGAFLLVMAWRLARGRQRPATETDDRGAPVPRISWAAGLTGGGAIGLLSALLGVGGGIVAIPILLRWARLDLHRIVPASLGIITMAALAGTLSYIVAGWGTEALPPGSLGFVHLPLFAAMLPGAILLAPVGARWNQALPVEALRRIFALLLLVIGVRLLWVNGALLLGS